MTEAELLASVRDACAWFGLRCYHTHDSRRSEAGFPDLVIVGRRVIFAELKAHSRVSRAQLEWLDALRDAGARVYLWRPENWPDQITRELRAIALRGVRE